MSAGLHPPGQILEEIPSSVKGVKKGLLATGLGVTPVPVSVPVFCSDQHAERYLSGVAHTTLTRLFSSF